MTRLWHAAGEVATRGREASARARVVRAAVAGLAAWILPLAPPAVPAAETLTPGRVRPLVEDFRRARDPADREAPAATLLAGGPDAVAKLATAARGELARLRQPYAARFQRAAAEVLKARRREGGGAAEVADLRKTILDVAADEGLTKETIVARSDPALARLELLFAVTPAEVLAADATLAADRAALLALNDVLLRCAGAAPAADHRRVQDAAAERFARDLVAAEEFGCLLAGPVTPADRQVLTANAGLARDLDPEEARGVVRLNVIRVLAGLPAQAIDAKLVAACRVHSRDMDERGFFDHESPVSGRETPWRRAEAAGTSASAENIFSGSDSGTAAIEAWWHSPGHHRNMLGRQPRTGLGRWKGFWTQLFG
ncbi:MAG: CAP domain-containing protein [Planctomycetaceae bacterium]